MSLIYMSDIFQIGLVSVLGVFLIIQAVFLIFKIIKRKNNDKEVFEEEIKTSFKEVMDEKKLEASVVNVSTIEEEKTFEQLEIFVEQEDEEKVIESVEETTLEKSELETIDEDNDVEEEIKQGILIRYNKSFMAKLIQSQDIVKENYNDLKNALMTNKKVSSRVSWSCDSINYGRTKLAKFNVRGKTLYLYLALDPQNYEGTNIKVETTTSKRYLDTPCVCKIKNPRRKKVAIDLILELIEKFGLVKDESKQQNYYVAYETTETLIEKKLIKELATKQQYDTYKESINKLEEFKNSVSVDDVKDIEVENINEYVSFETIKSNNKRKVEVINIDTLNKYFNSHEKVSIDTLKEKKLISKNTTQIKVLARGILQKPLEVHAHVFSDNAIKMIVITGGKVVKIN